MARFIVSILFAALLAACAHAPETDRGFRPEAAREAAGGARWSQVEALRGRGTLSVGGLSGAFESLEDVRAGKSVNSYSLGPIEGAGGYDGEAGWSRTGGETVAPDSAEALAQARTDAWLTRRGYFSREGAAYGAARVHREDGVAYAIVEATPEGGSPVELWFDAESMLLARQVQQIGQDRQEVRYEDYRDVDGVRVPLRIVNEGNDPRNRSVVVFETVEAASGVPATAYARPAEVPDDFRFVDGSHATTLRFDLINNHIYVDAAVDDQPVRLLFDTGGINLLTPAAVQRLGLSSEGKMAVRGVGEEQVDLGFAKAGRLQLGTLRLDDPLFYVLDLGELPAVEGFEFDGLVGYEIFHRLGVRIDYAAGAMTLTHPEHYRAPAQAIVVPFVIEGRIPVVDGAIDGRPAKLSIDTGSRSSLSLHSPYVREHGLIAQYGATFEAVNGWGVGGPSKSWPVRVATVRLGEAEVHDVVADLVTGDTGAFANPDISANVGSGLLRRFVVEFDYRARRLYLVPGADRDYREHYDRAGMWLLLDGDALRVAAVTAGGPAERAGLQAGDRIVAVAGIAPAERPLADWRAYLRETPAGTRVPLRYRRDDAVRSTELVLADLIPPPQ